VASPAALRSRGASAWRGSQAGLTDCKKRVAEHLKRACLVLARGSAEDVDGGSDDDIAEAGVFEHLLPARTGSPPAIQAAQRSVSRSASDEMARLFAMSANCSVPAGSQDAPDLGEDGLLVGAEIDRAVGDDDVGPAVCDGKRFGESFAELGVGEAERLRGLPGFADHLRGHVDADDSSFYPHVGSGDEGVEPGAGANVDDPFTRVRAGAARRGC